MSRYYAILNRTVANLPPAAAGAGVAAAAAVVGAAEVVGAAAGAEAADVAATTTVCGTITVSLTICGAAGAGAHAANATAIARVSRLNTSFFMIHLLLNEIRTACYTVFIDPYTLPPPSAEAITWRLYRFHAPRSKGCVTCVGNY